MPRHLTGTVANNEHDDIIATRTIFSEAYKRRETRIFSGLFIGLSDARLSSQKAPLFRLDI